MATKEIPLTRGLVTIVNASDYDWLMQWKWHASSKNYVTRAEYFYINNEKKQKRIWMHRFIIDAPSEMFTDHINGNKLDNRRENLRLCTKAENSRNVESIRGNSKYKGVCQHRRTKRWEAHIGFEYKSIYIGSYGTQEEAALAYNGAALKYFGEFARLNAICS